MVTLTLSIDAEPRTFDGIAAARTFVEALPPEVGYLLIDDDPEAPVFEQRRGAMGG